MKNKEIEELLEYLKDEEWHYYPSDLILYKTLLMEERDLLLSYIEELEKENQQLKEQKDDVVEFIKLWFPTGINNRMDKILRMLGEINDK